VKTKLIYLKFIFIYIYIILLLIIRVELILQGKQVDHLNQLVKEYSDQLSQLKMDIQAYDNQITSKYSYLLSI